MKKNEYNRKFAWENGFGAGLVSGIEPGSRRWIDWTKAFQLAENLDVDGLFGPLTYSRYLEVYGNTSPEVRGIDVSKWQRPRDLPYASLKAFGFDFAIVKALQGVGGEARHCADHTARFHDAGMLVGHYHYATPYTDGINDARSEAERFVEILERYGDDELIPALDLEAKGYKRRRDENGEKTEQCKHGQAMYTLWKGARAEYQYRMNVWTALYLKRFRALYGRLPMLYSYPSYLAKRLDLDTVDPIVFDCPLWLAAYVMDDPRVVYRVDDRFRLVCQQYTSDGDADTREVFDHGLDLNRAPWGLGPMLRRRR